MVARGGNRLCGARVGVGEDTGTYVAFTRDVRQPRMVILRPLKVAVPRFEGSVVKSLCSRELAEDTLWEKRIRKSSGSLLRGGSRKRAGLTPSMK